MKNNLFTYLDENHLNLPGKAKHYSPATRTWLNSVYTYNNNDLLNMPHNDKIVNILLNMYFHLRPKPKKVYASKRMRDFFKRSSTTQILLGKAEVKQTSDKATVTVYTYNRQNKRPTKNLLTLKTELRLLTNKKIYLNKKRPVHKLLDLKRSRKNQFKRNISKTFYLNKTKFKKSKLVNIKKYSSMLYKSFVFKREFIKTLFLFRFLKWSLSMLNINVIFCKKHKDINVIYQNNYSKLRFSNNTILLTKGKKYNILKCIILDRLIRQFNIKGKLSVIKLRTINNILLTYFNTATKQYSNKNLIYTLLNYYSNKYTKAYTSTYLKKQKIILSNLIKLYTNKVKYGKMIPGLKILIGYIYKKKVELNIVNLKYLHLNSQMLTNAIAIKLRKKTGKWWKVLTKAMKLIRLPKKIHLNYNPSRLHILKKLTIKDLTEYSKLVNKANDVIQVILNQMFINKKQDALSNNTYTINNILNKIKYKWVTGAKIEVKGRLTKRYTASRAIYKYKIKGSLRNLQHKYEENKTNKNWSYINIRNQIKPNLQYSLVANKRRVGTYGIKGWISSI